jgi:hypothetical protein
MQQKPEDVSMYFIVWSGMGFLVPVIAIGSVAVCAGLLGHVLPEAAVNFISALVSAVSLAAAGLYFKGNNVRRHLYRIPMEVWAIAAAVIALLEIPAMFGH